MRKTKKSKSKSPSQKCINSKSPSSIKRSSKNLNKNFIQTIVKENLYKSEIKKQKSTHNLHENKQCANKHVNDKNFHKKDSKNLQKKSQLNKTYYKFNIQNRPTYSTKDKSLHYKQHKQFSLQQQPWKQNLSFNIVKDKTNQTKLCISDKSYQCLEQINEVMSHLQNKQQFLQSDRSFVKQGMISGSKIMVNNNIFNLNIRIIVVDWIFLIGAQLLLKRQTVQLSIHYLDCYFQDQIETHNKIYSLAAGALLLSVKQQQRQNQSLLLQQLTTNCSILLNKVQILQMERQIIIKLKFKLKCNTLAFWIDYFSMKWDTFILRENQFSTNIEQPFVQPILLRDSEGNSYKYYRQLSQLSDILLYFSEHSQYQKSKLSLACLYLVIRIQTSLKITKQNQQWQIYYANFHKKASPIFKDPLQQNEVFNEFLTQLCDFQLTQIIPSIKFVARYLNIPFTYNIDQRAYKQANTYEEFMSYMTYSNTMKIYAENIIKSCF